MVGIALTQFLGEIPRLNPHSLPDGHSTVAVNIDTRTGMLVPLRAPAELAKISNLPNNVGLKRLQPRRVLSFWGGNRRLYGMFLDPNATLVRSPVANDIHDRVFVATSTGGVISGGSDGPFYASRSQFEIAGSLFRLGVPDGPSFNVISSGGSGSSIQRVYAATWVTTFGEESVIGPAIVESGFENGTWTVQNYPSSKPNPLPNAVHQIRFYRAMQSSGKFKFLRTVELPPDSDWVPSFTDTVSEASLALRSGPPTDAFAPPQTLQGLAVHPNGFLLGFVGRDVYMSVPYKPHAWPPSNVIRVQNDIVTMRVIGDAVAVLTTANPVLLVGSSPQSLTAVEFEEPYACQSARSAVVYKDKVIYASYEGLVVFGFGGAEILTSRLLTPEQWRTQWFNTNMKAVVWSDHYLAIEENTGFLVSLTENTGLVRIVLPISVTSIDEMGDDGSILLSSGDRLLTWMPDSTTQALDYAWNSKPILTPKPVNFSGFTVKLENTPAADIPIEDISDLIDYNQAVFPTLTGALAQETLLGPLTVATPPAGRLPPPVRPLASGGLYPVSGQGAIGGAAPLTVRITANEETIFESAHQDEGLRRLPSGFTAHRWSVALTGRIGVVNMTMAETVKELRSVG